MTVKRVEWGTKLGAASQDFIGLLEDELIDNKTGLERHADDLTVASLREISAELDQELERIRIMQERVNHLKIRLREVVGI